jgi:hypothetical protein
LVARRNEYIRSQTAIQLSDHYKEVANIQSVANAVGGVISLLSPEDGARFQQIAGGGIQVYEAVGAMMLEGALTPGGIGAVAGGISMISSAFGSQEPSADEVIIQMLQKVLENQKIMIGKLESIEKKTDRLIEMNESILKSLDEVLSALDDDQREVLREFQKLSQQMGRVQEQLNSAIQQLFQEELLGDFERRTKALIKPFDPLQRSVQYNSLKQCQDDYSSCDERAKDHISDIEALMTEIRETIINASYNTTTFAPPFQPLDVMTQWQDITNKITETSILQRASLLKHVAEWVGPEQSGTTQNPGRQNIFRNVGNPYAVSLLTQLYVDLVLLKPTPDRFGSRQPHNDIAEVADMVLRVDNAAKELRYITPRALMMTNETMLQARDLIDTILNGVNDQLIADQLIKPEDRSPIHFRGLNDVGQFDDLQAKLTVLERDDPLNILFAGLTEEAIRAQLNQMDDIAFAKLGERLSVWEIEDNKSFSGSTAHPDIAGYQFPGFKLPLKYRNNKFNYNDPKYKSFTFGERNGLGPYFRETLNIERFLKFGNHQYTIAKSQRHLVNAFNNDRDPEPTFFPVSEDRLAKRQPFTDALIVEIQKRQKNIAVKWTNPEDNEVFATLKSELDQLSVTLARHALVLDTAVRGGFGECLDLDPDLNDLRVRLEATREFNVVLYDMLTSDDFDDLWNKRFRLKELNDIVGSSHSVLDVDWKTTIDKNSQDVVHCSLGFGQINRAVQSLDNASQYKDLCFDKVDGRSPQCRIN